jgi:hypothetical protein
MSQSYETLGQAITKLLREQQDLLDETVDNALKGPIYIRIQQSYDVLEQLIDKAVNSKTEEYKAAIGEVGKAIEAVQDARKKLAAVVKALKAVDSFLKAVVKVVEVVA